jgi:hypothetical protein
VFEIAEFGYRVEFPTIRIRAPDITDLNHRPAIKQNARLQHQVQALFAGHDRANNIAADDDRRHSAQVAEIGKDLAYLMWPGIDGYGKSNEKLAAITSDMSIEYFSRPSCDRPLNAKNNRP